MNWYDVGRKVVLGGVIVTVAVMAHGTASGAQQIAVRTTSAESSAAGTLMARLVTVELADVSVKEAVKIIAESASVRLQYQAELFDAIRHPISLRMANAPLGVVFNRALAGTTLHAVPFGDDVVTIKKAAISEVAIADGVIVGKVVHAKTQQPIAGAKVTLDALDAGVVTDANGEFRITAQAGEHTVHVRGLGMMKQDRIVTVADGKTVALEIVMEPSASVLNEVVVTGTVVATQRKAIATPITVITADEIERRGITRVDQFFRGEVPGLLALETGTEQWDYSDPANMTSSALYSRGAASLEGKPNPIKTYVDGVELLDPSFLGSIDPSSIDRIEIITGPQAATIYGSGAMGGVMQIFTKKGVGATTPTLSLNLRYGTLQNSFSNGLTPSHNHVLGVTGGNGPQLSYAGNLSYVYTGQWQPALYKRRYGASLGATTVMGALTVSGSAGLTMGANGTSGQGSTYVGPGVDQTNGIYYSNMVERLLRESGEALPTNRTAQYFTRIVSRVSSQAFTLNLDYRMSPVWQHHLTVGRSQNSLSLEPTEPGYTYLSSSSQDTLYRHTASSGHRTSLSYNTTVASRLGQIVSSTVTVGGDGSWGERLTSRGCMATAAATSYVPCSTYGSVSVDRPLNEERWGGFGSVRLGFWDQVYLSLDVRGERNPNYGREHKIDWTPTTGATYTMELGQLSMKFLASYGKATRPPSPEQRLKVLTNAPGYDRAQYISQVAAPALTPEYSHGPQGGIELYFGNRGSFTLNHYSQLVDDLIQRIAVDSAQACLLDNPSRCRNQITWQFANVAKIRSRGWSGTGTANVGPLAFKGAYSWDYSMVVSVHDGRVWRSYGNPGHAFQGLPTHTGSISATYAHGPASVSFVTNYVGASSRWGLNYDPRSLLQNIARHKMYLEMGRNPVKYFDTPGYAKTDVTMSTRLNPWATATLNIVNLTNDFSSDRSVMQPSLGRQTLVGVMLRYPQR